MISTMFFFRLLKDYRKEMDSLTLRWGKLLLPLMAHRATKIHEKALEVVKSELPSLLQHQRELVQALIPEFKLVGFFPLYSFEYCASFPLFFFVDHLNREFLQSAS